jgi:hypothetical protein
VFTPRMSLPTIEPGDWGFARGPIREIGCDNVES